MTTLFNLLMPPSVWTCKTKSMSKRRRKRLYRGEYTILGFNLVIEYKGTNAQAQAEPFFDNFIEVIEQLDCCICGWLKTTDQPKGKFIVDLGKINLHYPMNVRNAIIILNWVLKNKTNSIGDISFSKIFDINNDNEDTYIEMAFETLVTIFFEDLYSKQEPLGREFERVLFENLSDLYQN